MRGHGERTWDCRMALRCEQRGVKGRSTDLEARVGGGDGAHHNGRVEAVVRLERRLHTRTRCKGAEVERVGVQRKRSVGER